MNADTSFWNDSGLPDDVVRTLGKCTVLERNREVLLVGLGGTPLKVVEGGRYRAGAIRVRLDCLGYPLTNKQLSFAVDYVKRLVANERRYSREPAGVGFVNAWRSPEYIF
jgi:hypothetical protein